MEQDRLSKCEFGIEIVESYMDLVSCSVGRLSIQFLAFVGMRTKNLRKAWSSIATDKYSRDLFEDASNNRLTYRGT